MTFQYNNNQCVQLSSINDTVFWANNSTNNTIIVQPLMWPPFVTYEDKLITKGNSSILHYEYCVPFIVLLIHFAKYINAK